MIQNWGNWVAFINELNIETNRLAEEVKTIREGMQGKGVYPADSPFVMERLQEVENKLRQIGSNKDYPLG